MLAYLAMMAPRLTGAARSRDRYLRDTEEGYA